MRVLVHGDSLRGHGRRMAVAAQGLALRGHEVLWRGAAPEGLSLVAAVSPAAGGLALARHHADVVLGGDSPRAVAPAGWLVRAHAMVLALDAGAVTSWGPLDRGCWGTLHASGLVEEADGESLLRDPRGLDLERLALWPAEPPAEAPDAAHLDSEILERACERALARHRGRASRAAVFVDRDGTIVVEKGYLSDAGDLELLPGAAEALQNLRSAGFVVVVISNQAGVGRGLFPLARVYEAMARLRTELRARGVELDAIYFCPHRPDAGCACRKPGTALLERAADDLQLSLRRSVMIGDKLIDAETGRNAGGRGVLVRTGYGRDEERRLEARAPGERPDFVADDLADAAGWILRVAEPVESG